MKTLVRRTVRRHGYDLVPFLADFGEVQRDLLQDVDLVVDVGANVGQYAERVRDLGYRSQIISFEPSRAAFQILRNKAGRDSDWQARNQAVGASVGEAILHLSENSVSSSMLAVSDLHISAAPGATPVGEELVEVTTLDTALHAVKAADIFLKLDTQGFEVEVLAGASTTLSRVKFLQTEASLLPLYEGGSDWLELCQVITSRGFRLGHVEAGFQDPNTRLLQQVELLFVRD